MTFITVITTILYALGLPIFVEVRRLYYKLWNQLILFQRYLIELANEYLWPWVADLLKMINFESIRELYNDIKESKMKPEQCVQAYIDRSGPFEYIFIIFTSGMIAYLFAKMFISPFENYILTAPIMKKFVNSYPIIFRMFFYPLSMITIYMLYMLIAYVLYFFNQIFKARF